MRICVEAYGLGIISVDPQTLQLRGRNHRFALYERPEGGQLLVPLTSADLIERVAKLP